MFQMGWWWFNPPTGSSSNCSFKKNDTKKKTSGPREELLLRKTRCDRPEVDGIEKCGQVGQSRYPKMDGENNGKKSYFLNG